MPEAPDLRFPIEELQNFCSLRPKKYETCCDPSDLESPSPPAESPFVGRYSHAAESALGRKRLIRNKMLVLHQFRAEMSEYESFGLQSDRWALMLGQCK